MPTVSRTVSRSRRRSGTLYRDLADELVALIDQGALRPGDRLPSVRSFARQRHVSLTTVLRVYQLLEDRGQVEVRPQSGHYVAASRPAVVPTPSRGRVPPGPDHVRVADLVWALHAQITNTALAPFGVATIAPQHHPVRRLGRILARLTREAGPTGMVYGDPTGHELLRHQILRRALGAGLTISPEELVVTNGCTEAVQIALRALTRPGDTLLVESPSFYGSLESVESIGLKTVEVAADPETGISAERLEAAIRRVRPRVFLTTPSYQNPLGFTVPDSERRLQAEVLARYGVAAIEDDVYAELHHGPTRPRPLKAFDNTGDVLLCSSFSKTIAPAYRVGWIAAGRHFDRVRKLKAAFSFHTNTLAQLAVAEFVGSGGAEHHFRRLRQALRTQVADYTDAIGRAFPPGTRISRPKGGYLLWVELPRGTDATALHEQAQARQIGIVSGRLFSPSGTYGHCIRLSCGHPLRGRLEEALRTLGALAAGLVPR